MTPPILGFVGRSNSGKTTLINAGLKSPDQGVARDQLKDMIELLDRMSKRTFEARESGRLAREKAEQEKVA